MQTATPEKSRIRHEDALRLIAEEARPLLKGFEGPWGNHDPEEEQVWSVLDAVQSTAARLVALYEKHAAASDAIDVSLGQAASIAGAMVATAEGLLSRELSFGQHAHLVDEDAPWEARTLAWSGLNYLANVLMGISEGVDLNDLHGGLDHVSTDAGSEPSPAIADRDERSAAGIRAVKDERDGFAWRNLGPVEGLTSTMCESTGHQEGVAPYREAMAVAHAAVAGFSVLMREAEQVGRTHTPATAQRADLLCEAALTLPALAAAALLASGEFGKDIRDETGFSTADFAEAAGWLKTILREKHQPSSEEVAHA